MLKKSRLWTWATICYISITVLFVVFFVYMNCCEGVSIQTARVYDDAYVVENCISEEFEDPSAPIGVRTEYRWTLGDIGPGDEALSFYLVHHCAEVYFDGTLMYRLMPDEDNRIMQSVGSNWVSIPLLPEDSGKEVRVIVTPAFESVRGREVVFRVGPHFQVYLTQLELDFPQLMLSVICCVLGILIMLAQLMLIWRKKQQNWFIFFVGSFTALLGLWKLTDTRFSAILFDEHTMLVGYLSLVAMIFSAISASLFLCDRFSTADSRLMPSVSILSCGVVLLMLVFQVLGVADFRQTLPLAHVIIIAIIISLIVTLLGQKKQGKRILQHWEWIWAALLILGALADLIIFYTTGTSANLICTLFAVPLATVLMFVANLADANKRAYTDSLSGLFNKNRWDELAHSPAIAGKPVGIIMFDLNRLKYVNDTMGHAAGDQMILNFANVLRNTIPPSETICRWGGDEFAVLSTDADREKLERYLTRIRDAAEAYNASGQTPELHFAAGYVLSSEYPGLSPSELLRIADERMYLDKHRWYSERALDHT